MNSSSEKPNLLDAGWYERFAELGAFSAPTYLATHAEHAEEQKNLFFANDLKNPLLHYPKLTNVDWKEREASLQAFKQEVLSQETHPVVRDAYRWRINEKIAEARLLYAAHTGDGRSFLHWSTYLHSIPNRGFFQYSLSQARTFAEDYKNDSQHAVRILESFPQPATFSPVPLPSKEAIETFRLFTEERLSRVLPSYTQSQICYAKEIQDVFQTVLEHLHADEWRVEIKTSGETSIGVDQEERCIRIPSTKCLDGAEMRKLIAHEVGTHVVRRLEGETTSLQLLGLGLDHYQLGEEGLATVTEQALSEEFTDYTGESGYLSIGFALGADGMPRDFRDVYNLMYPYYALKEEIRGYDTATVSVHARQKAWNRCVRTFRGTDGSTPGTCYTKDLVYRDGNIAIWNYIEGHLDHLPDLYVGRYDPTNPQHMWILQELDLL